MENLTIKQKTTKLLEIIKFDISGLSFSLGEKNDKRKLDIKYNNENNRYLINSYDKNGLLSTINLSEEELIKFFENEEVSKKTDELYNQRMAKEKKYDDTKKELLNKLNFMNISENDRTTLETIIEQTCQLSERVGNNNRVYISDIEHLRLADETKWDTRGEYLHLQLVVQSEGINGMRFTDYPPLSFEELVNYISSKNLTLTNDNTINKSR